MTASAPPPFRAVSFGDLGGEIWGAAIDAGDPAISFATPDGIGSASGAQAVALTEEGRSWRLASDGVELLITPTQTDGEEHPREGGVQLCQVAGTLSIAGAERSVQCVGTRSSGDGLDLGRLGRLESVRGVSGWFESDRGVGLLSFRPLRSAGQESDLVTATVFDPEGPVAIDDPRLSTTYEAGGRPSRANLELWIGDGDEQYPRRAAAEARGAAAGVDGDRVKLQVTPLQCHTAGLEGTGVYTLARF